MLVRVVVCLGMIAARLAELAYSRRNTRRWSGLREGKRSRIIFPLIVALHSTVMLGTLLFGKKPNLWLLLLLALQPLRAWVLVSLRHRWNARGAVSPDLDPVTTGPYTYVRHPNYSVVLLELAALALAFGLPELAVVATAANAALLTLRIRDEESLLFEVPGYAEHFATLPRLMPRLPSNQKAGRVSEPERS